MFRGRLKKFTAAIRRQMSMPSSHQGSAARYLLGKAAFSLRQTLKRGRKIAEQEKDPELSVLLKSYNRSVALHDWNAVLREANKIAAVAEDKANAAVMADMAGAFTRLCVYDRSAELGLAARRIRQGSHNNEWTGEDISSRSLLIELVESSRRSIGLVIRYAQLIAAAIPRANRCIVIVEPRLVPILKRSFPDADIRADGENNEAVRAETDVFATFEHLAYIFANGASKIERSISPLKADAVLSRQFRARYLMSKPGHLVGLSWGSKSYNKDVPDLREWSHFIRGESAQFVSLQYGKVSVDLPKLTAGDPARMIHDTSVDQLTDMDRFAAQICALDAVVSISNTAAHIAGALGVPSIFVIDDKFHTTWPVFGDTTPWYPRSQIVLKRDRDWPAVLEEVRARLHSILEKKPASRPA